MTRTGLHFRQILASPRPGDDLKAFIRIFPCALPRLELAAHIPAGPPAYHSGSVLKHIARCMNETAGDPMAVWMAFCHDAGKLLTDPQILPHHYEHEKRGAPLAALWARTLGFPQEYSDAAALACEEHMKAGMFPRLKPGKKLTLLERVFYTPYARSFWHMVDADRQLKISDSVFPIWEEILARKNQGESREGLILLVKHLSAQVF